MKIMLLSDTAKVPTRGSDYAAGYDLYADLPKISGEFVAIPPHQTIKISTGVAIEIPVGYFGGVFPRSGMSAKRGLRPANCVGVIDADYRGEIFVAIHNDSDEVQFIYPNERIAQLIVLPCCDFNWEVVDSLSTTTRGAGGFGSTGTK